MSNTPSEKRVPGFETLAVHAGQKPDPVTGACAQPIYLTSSYVFHDAAHAARRFNLEEPGEVYTRLGNPTTAVMEQRVAELEGGVAAVATASGQAAEMLAVTTLVNAGEEVVASTSLYGGTYTLLHNTLPKLGVKVKFVDPADPESFRKAVTEKTRLLYGETVGNPQLDSFPITEVAAIGREYGIPLAIDNTMPSPYLVNPIRHGANIVIHSLTKFLSGHGTVLGGAVVDGGNFDWGASGRFPSFVEPDASYHGVKFVEKFGPAAFAAKARLQGLRDQGMCLSPLNAWLTLQGIETLHVRMERHSQNGQAVAEYLAAHPKVAWVNYPGLESHKDHERAKRYHHRGLYGAIIGFGVKGGYDAAVAVMERLRLFSLLANIGDAKSLVIHPASTTHGQLSPEEQAAGGVTPDFIRLSIGIESIDDILADLEQALG